MRYKMTKNIKFVITGFVFFKLKCTQIRFRHDAPPDPLVGWGGGSPIHLPARRLQRLELARFSGPLNTKSWLRQCFRLGNLGMHDRVGNHYIQNMQLDIRYSYFISLLYFLDYSKTLSCESYCLLLCVFCVAIIPVQTSVSVARGPLSTDRSSIEPSTVAWPS